MSRFMRRWSSMLLLGLAISLPAGLVGGLTATWFTRASVADSGVAGVPASVMQELKLKASGSHGAAGLLAMATGGIDEGVEGVYTLDFVTGNLQCFVLPRGQQFAGGQFKTNILGDLPAEKGKTPNYVIVTGAYSVPAVSGNVKPANSVVYVADANTGMVVAYGLPWNRTQSNSGVAQADTFTKLLTFKARDQMLRE